MSIAQICLRHMPTLKTAGCTDRDLVRTVLTSRPYHRWDAFLMDVVTHLARRANARFTPSHETLPRIKMIFDMDADRVAQHLSATCRVARDVGDTWCDVLWFDRMSV